MMVALRDSEIVSVPIADAIATRRVVPVTHGLIASARAIGIAFGDEKI